MILERADQREARGAIVEAPESGQAGADDLGVVVQRAREDWHERRGCGARGQDAHRGDPSPVVLRWPAFAGQRLERRTADARHGSLSDDAIQRGAVCGAGRERQHDVIGQGRHQRDDGSAQFFVVAVRDGDGREGAAGPAEGQRPLTVPDACDQQIHAGRGPRDEHEDEGRQQQHADQLRRSQHGLSGFSAAGVSGNRDGSPKTGAVDPAGRGPFPPVKATEAIPESTAPPQGGPSLQRASSD